MNSILSRWPVLQEHDVTAADLDGDGGLRPEIIDGWLAAARLAYLDLTSLAGRHLATAPRRLLDLRTVLGAPPGVAISVGVAEIHPESFTLNLRLRPLGDDENRQVTVQYVVTVSVSNELRDELIALEHAAQHFN